MLDAFLIQALQIFGYDEKGSIQFIFEAGASIFSLVLFAVTMFAWSRRKQRALIIVGLAFLAYFSKLLIEILPFGELHDDLVSASIDFVTLALFFVALVIRPQRGNHRESMSV
ncbi:MAG: hypothetical protein JRN15_03215 [Nitrososphaerota archaeon]|nr:hypothetical protein [Nitrososphaerota archaeon]